MECRSDRTHPLSAEDRFRRKYPLGIEKDFEKKYGHFPTTKEMITEIAKLKRTGKWTGKWTGMDVNNNLRDYNA